jgi:Flp pilus assembly pilin Flp
MMPSPVLAPYGIAHNFGDCYYGPSVKTLNCREMGAEMNLFLQKLCARFSFLLTSNAAKDLIEYTLVLTLIAFGAVTSMNTLFGVLTKTFLGFATTLDRYVS